MDNTSINNRFRSILYAIIHFSCSLIQLAGAFAILGLQITLTVTQTCAFRIGVGFWSFPFLFLSPISIWILLWKRSVISCFLSFIFHICATLFATAIIIISFLTLIGQIGSVCSTSSTSNTYFLSINITLLAIAVFLKIFFYAEMVLLYFLQRHTNDSSILSDKEFPAKTYQIITDDTRLKPRTHPFRSINDKNQHNIRDLDV